MPGLALLLACPAPTDGVPGDSEPVADTGVGPPLERWTGDAALGDAPRVLEGLDADQAGGVVPFDGELWMTVPQRDGGLGSVCAVEGDGPSDRCWVGRHAPSFAGTEAVVVQDRLALSAFWDGANGSWSGAVFVVDGAGGELAEADAVFEGSAASYAGAALAVGDVADRGEDQLLIGAFAADAPRDEQGIVFIVDPLVGGQLEDAEHRISGAVEGDWYGTSVATGDVDGDGVLDVLGGGMADDGDGGAWVTLGPVQGHLSTQDADVELVGGGTFEYAGKEVALGDVNGDGLDDIVVSATDADEVYVVWGPGKSGTLASSDAVITGPQYGTLGFSLGAEDLDRDQHADVQIGATRYEDAGAAFVFYGPLSGALEVESADWILRGEAADDKAGIDVQVFDWQLAVSASRAADGRGRVYLYER